MRAAIWPDRGGAGVMLCSGHYLRTAIYLSYYCNLPLPYLGTYLSVSYSVAAGWKRAGY
jgi:hypothetical protein